MSSHLLKGLAVTWVVAMAAAAQEQTVMFRDGESPYPQYTGTRDIRITDKMDSVYDPNGNFDALTDQVDGFSSQKSALLRWDLSALPAGATIETASITLNVVNTSVNSYPIYECLRAWSATQATFMQARAGEPWAVSGAQGVGTDRGSAVLGTVNGASTGAVTFNLNASGLAVIQAWVSGARPNNGFVVQDYAMENGLEWRSANENQASRRPRLSVTYNGGARMDFQNGAAPTTGYAGNVDTTLASGAPPGWTVWNGWGHNLDGSGGKHESALLAFDLSAIAPGARVKAVSLVLHVTNPSTDSYPVYEALQPWNEGRACWFEYDSGQPWSAVGADSTGDHGGVVLGSSTASTVGTVTIPLNAAGVRLVQDWVDGRRPNHGLELINYLGSDDLSFDDRENPTSAVRPALQVTFDGTLVLPVTTGTDGVNPTEEPSAAATPVALEALTLSVGCDCQGAPGAPASVGAVLALIAFAASRRKARAGRR